jgi:hypothetical protein
MLAQNRDKSPNVNRARLLTGPVAANLAGGQATPTAKIEIIPKKLGFPWILWRNLDFSKGYGESK